MRRIRGWFEPLRPADLFSLSVIIVATAEFILAFVASPYNVSGRLALSVLLQALTVFVAFGFAFAVYRLLHRQVTDDTMRVVLLLCLPIGALIGGTLLGWFRLRLGLDATSLIPLRAFTAVLHITAVSVLLWMALSGIRLHYARLTVLTRERDRLVALERQAAFSLTELDTKTTEMVRARILDGVAGSGSNDVHDVLRSLTTTLEDTVRPLSRQLESQSDDWNEPHPELSEIPRLDWRAAASGGTEAAIMSPVGLLIIVSLMGTPMNIARVGVVFAVLFMLLTFLIVLPLACLIRRLFVRLTRTLAGWARAYAFIALCVAIGTTWAVVLLPISIGTPEPFRFFYLASMFVLIVAYIWGVAVAAQRQALASEVAVRQAADDLVWSIAVSRELHRQRCQALAHAVHGEVQAALAAGILELDRALRDGTVDATQINAVRSRIIHCVQRLNLRSIRPSPLDVVTAKVQATWTDVIALSVFANSALESSLGTDERCLMTLNDVIPELVFNSIKHGKAQNVTMTLDVADHRTLRLTALDDGAITSDPGESGMGSRLLDTCAVQWSRVRTGERTLTTVLLPFEPSDQPNARFEGFPLKSDDLIRPSA
jgi:hypothetical protein